MGETAICAPFGRPPDAEQVLGWFPQDSPAFPSASEFATAALADPRDPYAPLRTSDALTIVRTAIEAFAPDTIVVSRLQMWALAPAWQGFTGTVILDLDEVAGPLAESLAELHGAEAQTRLRQRFFRAIDLFEEQVVPDLEQIWLSSPLEAERFSLRYPGEPPPSVVPNGIDVTDRRSAANSARSGILFPGNFAYPPNVDAAHIIIDEITPVFPGVKVSILGSNIPLELAAKSSPQIRVEGPIDDMHAEFAGAAVTVLPLRAGGGTRLKALESLAAGTPLVATPKAVEGLDLEDGTHCLIGNEVEDLVDLTRETLVNPAEAHARAERGFEVVRDRYSLDAVTAAVARSLIGR